MWFRPFLARYLTPWIKDWAKDKTNTGYAKNIVITPTFRGDIPTKPNTHNKRQLKLKASTRPINLAIQSKIGE